MVTPTLTFSFSSSLLSHLSFFPLTLLCLLYEGLTTQLQISTSPFPLPCQCSTITQDNIQVCSHTAETGFSQSPCKGLSSPSPGLFSSPGTNGNHWILYSEADGGICTWYQQKFNILRAVPARKWGAGNILEADVHYQALFFRTNIPGYCMSP